MTFINIFQVSLWKVHFHIVILSSEKRLLSVLRLISKIQTTIKVTGFTMFLATKY